MKNEFVTTQPYMIKAFLFMLLFAGLSNVIKGQNIDFNAGCPNGTFALKEQEVGTAISSSGMWAILPITAVNPPGGQGFTLSTTRIDVTKGGFSTGEGCDPCTGAVSIHGINFTVSGTNFTITGTPDNTSAGYNFSITLQATAGGTVCSRTYTFNIVSKGTHQGDPHMTTVDGAHYDFQGVGEFVLLKGDSSDSFEIQTRQTAVATDAPGTDPNTGITACVSINTAMAARVGTHQVSYQPNINGEADSSGMQLRVDGKLVNLTDDGLELGRDARIMKLTAGNGIEIDFPNGMTSVITSNWWSYYGVWYLNIDIYRTKATKGLMGAIAPESWLPKLPDGKSVGPVPESRHERFVQLYETFANAWRVTDQSSLFDYATGTSTATFTNKNWPTENAESCGIPNKTPQPPIELSVAEQLSRDILDPNMKANAIFDIMLTGETSFAKAYLISQEIQQGATMTIVTASRDTTQHKESVTFTATVAKKFMAGETIQNGNIDFYLDGKEFKKVAVDANGVATIEVSSLEKGQHQISAKFIPESDTVLASSSTDLTHTVVGGDAGGITHHWWFWLVIILLILGVIILLLRKKKNV